MPAGRREPIAPLDVREIAASVEPSVAFRARTGHRHRTWAGTYHSRPELYLRPESVAEVRKIVRLARLHERRVVVTGSGHSPSDITCTSSWLVNIDALDGLVRADPATGIVQVQAGMRLFDLCDRLDALGLALPSLGSINEQSIAGAISTGTHGSSMAHGLLSNTVEQIVLVTATEGAELKTLARADADPTDFRAALLSLGMLGVIVEVTLRAVPKFNLRWSQRVLPDGGLFGDEWTDGSIWSRSEFARVWYFPYSQKYVLWQADKVDDATTPLDAAPRRPSFQDGLLGRTLYKNALAAAVVWPKLVPWIERKFLALQYGRDNVASGAATTGVQPSRDALLMNCLYSQFVDEWAVPFGRAAEAVARLRSWLNRLGPGDEHYVPHGIPYSADGLFVHAPIEVRVVNMSAGFLDDPSRRPLLDPSDAAEPSVYINATLYRPYGLDPPCHARYYQGFEYLMRALGGRPHWAKNFTATAVEVRDMYGADCDKFLEVRDRFDPKGVFVGPWHRKKLLGGLDRLPNEEIAVDQRDRRLGGKDVTYVI